MIFVLKKDKMKLTFPREIAFPNRVLINSQKEFYENFNKYNGIKQKIYFSLYNQDKDIDLISFDLDDKNCFTNCKKIHYYLKSKNLKHLMTFSTRGFWIYIYTKNYENLENKKDALKNSQLYILKQAEVNVDEVDKHILGDIARISRLPCSFDTKRKRYCIPLKEEDLLIDYEYVCELSEKQRTQFTYYGSDLLDIKQFDRKCEQCLDIPVLNYDSKMIIEKDSFLKTLPLCLAQVLVRGDTHWRERFFIILYLREKGFMISEVIEVFRQFMSPEKFQQDIIKERHVQLIYQRQDLVMANQETLIKEGICGSWCNHENNKIYK